MSKLDNIKAVEQILILPRATSESDSDGVCHCSVRTIDSSGIITAVDAETGAYFAKAWVIGNANKIVAYVKVPHGGISSVSFPYNDTRENCIRLANDLWGKMHEWIR